MNRDEGIYNLSHVYDPVIQDEVNIKNTFGTGSDRKFSRHSAVGSQQQHYQTKQTALVCKTVDKKREFLTGLDNYVTLDCA